MLTLHHIMEGGSWVAENALIRTRLPLVWEIIISNKIGLPDINHRDTWGNYLHYSKVLSLHVHVVILHQSVSEICGRGEDIWSQGQLSVPQLRNISRQPQTEIHWRSRSTGKIIQPSPLELVSPILLVSQFISCSHPGLHLHPNAGVSLW